jgi:hypothetical protein
MNTSLLIGKNSNGENQYIELTKIPVLIISFIFLLRDLIFKPPIYKRIKF